MTARRLFLGAPSAVALRRASAGADRPALLGGKPVRWKKFPAWPAVRDNDKRSMLGAFASDEWLRRGGTRVAAFDELCKRAFWLGQTALLGESADRQPIAEAFRKVQRHAGALKAALGQLPGRTNSAGRDGRRPPSPVEAQGPDSAS